MSIADDLLVFNDLGINEQKLVRTEIRKQNNDYHVENSSKHGSNALLNRV